MYIVDKIDDMIDEKIMDMVFSGEENGGVGTQMLNPDASDAKNPDGSDGVNPA